MHSIQWHTLKIQINQHLEYHKLEFGLQRYLKFTSLRLTSSQTTYKSQYTPMTYITVTVSPTIYSKIFLQSITLFTPDPAEYRTTISFKLNNQTPTTIKTSKNSWNYF